MLRYAFAKDAWSGIGSRKIKEHVRQRNRGPASRLSSNTSVDSAAVAGEQCPSDLRWKPSQAGQGKWETPAWLMPVVMGCAASFGSVEIARWQGLLLARQFVRPAMPPV